MQIQRTTKPAAVAVATIGRLRIRFQRFQIKWRIAGSNR